MLPALPPSPPVRLASAGPFGRARVAPLRFGWPVRPFDRPHPLRGTFGEPRGILGLDLALSGDGRARFLDGIDQVASVGRRVIHTGVDIEAPDGTPVYAVQSGVAVTGGRGYERHVLVGDFGYWHLAGTVPSGTRVIAFRTVIGRVVSGQGHVHLTRFDRPGGRPVNPLVAGGLVPFVDHAPPRIGRLLVYAPDGRRISRAALRGPVALVVEARDIQSLGDSPTGLYRLGYTIVPKGGGRPAVGPVTVAEFDALPPVNVADYLYTLGSTRHGERARFRYRLTARSPSCDGLLHAEALRPGRYLLEVRVADASGNEARRAFGLRVLAPLRPPAPAREVAGLITVARRRVDQALRALADAARRPLRTRRDL